MRLSDGFAHALSPDGRRAIVQSGDSRHFDVVPTGPGETVRLERPGLALMGARWLPDGANLLVRARTASGATHLYVMEVQGKATRQVTPAGIDVRSGGWAVSPDGALVAVSGGRELAIFPTSGGEPRRVPSASDRWTVVGWIEGGLLVSEDPAAGGTVHRVDPATGRRDMWADIQPQDPAGIMNLDLGTLVTTPDGRGYGYNWHRAMSDLYLVADVE